MYLLKFDPKRPGCNFNTELGVMMCDVRMIDLLRRFRRFSSARFRRDTASVFRPQTGCLGPASCVGTATIIWLVFCFVSTPESLISNYILPI
jgi:hypothetical protein